MSADSKWDRGVDDVAATLRTAKESDKGCALLIGAGCSVTAGIPAAAGIVARIREKHQLDYDRAPQKTYAGCMAEISAGERRDLIVKYVDAAKVNWAHVCIAQLMKEGYIDRVLTTNFDPLVIRACALVGHFPAVYDFASSQLFDPENLPPDAVVYLHGQRTGFVLLNTEREVKKHAKLLKPVFDEAGQNRVWIVAGYSGENDPVFDRLVEFNQFANRLYYWIGYGDADPASHVSNALLEAGKDAFFVRGMDSDAFFLQLASALDVFPPDFIGRPFSYLESLMDTLAALDTVQFVRKSPRDHMDGARDTAQPGRKNSRDYMDRARRMIREAVGQFERTDEAEAERHTEDLLISGRSTEVMNMASSEPAHDTELASQMAWAHVTEGNKFGDEALTKSGSDADALFRSAYENYAAALALQPEMHDALNNWALTLADQARMQTGAETDKLYRAAYEKFDAAVALAPYDFVKLRNWGTVLANHAWLKGEDADALYAETYEKYDRALGITPDDADTLNNYAVALADQAKHKSGDEAARLYAAARERHKDAVAAAPDDALNLTNWARTLRGEAEGKEGSAADELFEAAYEKHAAAHALDPSDAEVTLSWASTLSEQADRKQGDEAVKLYTEAFERYEEAYELGQNNDVLIDAAVALRSRAKWERGDEAARLFEEAMRRLRTAERNIPGSAAYNLACLTAIQGKRREAHRWLEKCKQLDTLPSEDEVREDTDLDSVRDTDWFKRLFSEG